MNSLLGMIGASLTTFATTNIDDAFVLTLFFARRVPTRRILAGQYLGFAAIIVISLACVWGARTLPHRWIRALGLFPLLLGAMELIRGRQLQRQESTRNYSLLSIIFITLSNGADNVGVYVPFFLAARTYIWIILSTYTGLVLVWCLIGRWLGAHPLVLRSIDRWGHWIAPPVFIGLGIYTLIS
jgi:cadmium resistance protein CadD (predicted permease)